MPKALLISDTNKKNPSRSITGQTVVKGASVDGVKTFIADMGLPVYVKEHDPLIHVLSSYNGWNFTIELGNANQKSGLYNRIAAQARYPSNMERAAALEKINQFNLNFFFAKGHLEKFDGRMHVKIRSDWLICRGVLGDQIAHWIELWVISMSIFETYWCDSRGN